VEDFFSLCAFWRGGFGTGEINNGVSMTSVWTVSTTDWIVVGVTF
jgi:hypothetical protein